MKQLVDQLGQSNTRAPQEVAISGGSKRDLSDITPNKLSGIQESATKKAALLTPSQKGPEDYEEDMAKY